MLVHGRATSSYAIANWISAGSISHTATPAPSILVSTIYRNISLPASTFTTVSHLPPSIQFVTRTISLAPTIAACSQAQATQGTASSGCPATITQTLIMTTTLMEPRAVITSTAFLPRVTVTQLVSFTQYRVVTAYVAQQGNMGSSTSPQSPQSQLPNSAIEGQPQGQYTRTLTACSEATDIEVGISFLTCSC